MRCEVLAVGTELLLGQIVDTNSAWIGEQLAAAGVDSYEHRQVGDNRERLAHALRDMLAGADTVIVCGGLGPTPDDLTRDAIADVMGVGLVRRPDLVEHIAAMFSSRGREMPDNNLRQADVPDGAVVLPNPVGTAPGLAASLGDKVVYAVPGVPYEMRAMITDHVLPALLERSGERSAIVSRTVKTWGTSESGLAATIAQRVDAQSNPTIAFLARGIEGLCVRVTAKASDEAEATALVDAEERELRAILGELVFGVDDETMESAVIDRLRDRGWTIGVAESLTGGLVGARLAAVPGASAVYRGGVVAYSTDVKRDLLGVQAPQVVSGDAAMQLADGARGVLGADVGISVTGVAGPDEQDGQPVGTVWFGLSVPGVPTSALDARLPGDRERIRQFSAITLLDLLRRHLDALE